MPNQSYPDQRQFFFAYSVTISNEGSDTVQLLSRHWVIHNAEGQKQEVRQAQLHFYQTILTSVLNYGNLKPQQASQIKRASPHNELCCVSLNVAWHCNALLATAVSHIPWLETARSSGSSVASMHVDCRGPGVVGETPVLKPGDVYEYTSACPLTTPTGSMKGEFEMIKVDKTDSGMAEPQRFLAEVAQFGLDMQQAVLA